MIRLDHEQTGSNPRSHGTCLAKEEEMDCCGRIRIDLGFSLQQLSRVSSVSVA
jgi:hypothetical protein